jgi:hypothetical protein
VVRKFFHLDGQDDVLDQAEAEEASGALPTPTGKLVNLQYEIKGKNYFKSCINKFSSTKY